MKKINASALLLPIIFISSNVSAVAVYSNDASHIDINGKIVGLHYFSPGKTGGDHSYARLGLKGSTVITDSMGGYGQWEYNLPLNVTESHQKAEAQSSTRLGFAGLHFGDMGSFDYGRNHGVLYNVSAWTDMMPEFGGNALTHTDNFLTGRASGVATYTNKNLFGLVQGLTLSAQYQGENDRTDLSTANGRGKGMSLTYTSQSGISIGAAVSQSHRTPRQMMDGKGSTANAWTAGVKYDANNLYLAALYSKSSNMTPVKATEGFVSKAQHLELVAQYQLENGLRPSLGYVESRGAGLTGKGAEGKDQALLKYIELGTTYQFNKNMSVYADYKLNLLKENAYTSANAIDTGNMVATGIIYQF